MCFCIFFLSFLSLSIKYPNSIRVMLRFFSVAKQRSCLRDKAAISLCLPRLWRNFKSWKSQWWFSVCFLGFFSITLNHLDIKKNLFSELSWKGMADSGQMSFSWYLMGWCLLCMSKLSMWRKKKKKKGKSECTYHWKACSAFFGCFLVLFLFYTQCMCYLWSCFWDVHWFKKNLL